MDELEDWDEPIPFSVGHNKLAVELLATPARV
jgi:hypothetical protein